jgi:tetrahydromethanopterin S-methyltransferase subunit H
MAKTRLNFQLAINSLGDGFMWQQTSEQKRFALGKVTIGGRAGENPTVLMGSIFYHKQRSLDFKEETGEFNRNECERLIKVQEEFSDRTGLPCMLDVGVPSKKWIDHIVSFVTSVTDAPMLLDAASTETRVAALDYAKETGIQDKCVYNSLNPESKKIEFDKIKETHQKAAVLLAYNARDMTAKGRVDAIRQLLPKAIESGIEKTLLDACVLDVPTLGSAFKAILELKNETGYPAGCGAHNAIDTWRGLKTKMGLEAVKPCSAAANALPIAAGADFILYGPIEDAPFVFPAVAMTNAAFAQLLIEEGKRPSPSHPIFKIA